ncbi:DUF3347 domain-containing protein [Pedobacter sp. N23S346]|uniref:DUF3347 domain-containing protein n=1 Tax=Pedobacter sp. N23S346 TaxID=3402750 RepID=UPI003AC87FE0
MKRIFGIVILAGLMACNPSEKKSSDKKDTLQKDSISVNNEVSIKDQKKANIFIEYVSLKDALVKADQKLSQKAAADLQKSLANFEGCEPTAEIAGKIAASSDLADQRKSFTTLSADLIALMKNAEIEKGTIYVQHCPMANKGDGGDWLSTEKEIRNPYYGDEMLECGRVTEELKAK